MKKTLSLILALLMSVSSASMIFADEAADVEPISAVTEEAPVEEAETDYDLAIEFLVNKSIMKGKEDGLRHAEDPVKRYEMAILTARVATGWTEDCDWMNGEADNTKFTDLEGSGAANALGAVSYANQKGIVVGYPDSTFKPENQVTYREALTMAVRTLGYTSGLEYPWGFIEKAVSLGLTEDIEDVAYTAPINRGVAAQIIYNALFAKTASGETLAMKSFDCEYGWEKILVVSDEIETITTEVGVTAAGKETVAFKLVNNDGTLGEETFYVKKDLTVGVFYEALFEMDADEELVDLIGAYEYVPTTIWNNGLTDDAGEAVTADAIKAYLEDYVLVDKYNVKNLSKTSFYDDEIIVKKDGTTTTYKYDYKTSKYAINWETGDILKNVDGAWVTEWYYNELYETYFKWGDKDSKVDGEDGIIGWDLMSDEELAALKEEIKASYLVEDKKLDNYVGTLSIPAYTAYASLEVYDLNGDDKGDVAYYDSYQFGKYEGIKENCADHCGDCDANDCIVFSTGHYVIEKSCDHKKVGNVYTWAEGFEATEGFTGYVIFGVNEAKNEVKIIKEIDGSDVDSYVDAGIVRGVNGAAKTVTIGDKTYSYDWKGLAGSSFENIADADRAAISAKFFNELFYQFVDFVVVDGKIAEIAPHKASTTNYIVVERYLGIDNDGYIVIEGYSTDDLKLETFRIGAFDGWKQGSVFFYEDVIEEEFTNGAVYQITSIDDSNDRPVYYVTCIGTSRDNKVEAINGNAAENVTVASVDGYRLTTIGNDVATKRLASTQKYVVINSKGDAYAPIFVFEGKLPNGWSITGDLLVKNDNLYIITNVTAWNGFCLDTYATGYVVLLNKFYKNVQFEGDGYYIYGATTYEVEAFNLLTGKTDDVAVGTNLDIDEDEIYVTNDKTIIDDTAIADWATFWTLADNTAYADATAANADYLFETAKFAPNYEFSAANISEDIVSDVVLNNKNLDVDDLVNSVTVKDLQLNTAGKIVDIVAYDATKYASADAIPAYLVIRPNGDKFDVVIYLNTAKVDTSASASDTIVAEKMVEVDEDAYIIAGADYTVDTTVVDGKTTYKTTINSLTLEFAGDATADTHANVLAKDLYFGIVGQCDTEKWNTTVTINGKTAPVYGTIAEGAYDDHKSLYNEAYKCDLVKAVAVAFENGVELNVPGWTDFIVDFTGTMHNDGDATYDAHIKLSFKTDADGKLIAFNIAGGSNDVNMNGATVSALVNFDKTLVVDTADSVIIK